MKLITKDDLFKNISEKKINNIYIFFGEDEFEKSEIVNKIKVLSEESEYFIFDSKNFDKEIFLSDIASNSFFSSRKVIFIKNFNAFKKDDKKFIINSIEKISNTNVLIINFEGEIKISEIEKEFIDIKNERIVLVKVNPPSPFEIKKYIKETLEKKGKIIEEKALLWLSENIDSHASLKNETEKILNYLGLKKEIKFDEVILLCVSHKETDRFSIIKAMLSKNKEEFIKIVNDLIESGEDALSILNTIELGLEKILKISVFQKSNIYDTNILYLTNIFKNELNLYNLRFINENRLIKIIEYCLETENTLKSSTTANPYILIRNLCVIISDFLTTF